ncbi:response regulator transcription factor [Singulisphaera sp. PoT]|uniref:response regulator transcription factor n=1 Tax=Singulisphaera sp. PoT TaxID=3411797 RepID=UPI003BF47605
MALSVLIIDDELDFAEFIINGLAEEGFSVEHALDGLQGGRMLKDRSLDLILLDWGLPRQDRLSLLKGYRLSGGDAPVIFLTARDEVHDRGEGLDVGADDYLCKPFAFAELLARVRALACRRERPSNMIVRHGDVSVDLVSQKGQRAGQDLDFTAKELALLFFFLRHPGQILSRNRIDEGVWNEDFDTTSNTFEVHLKELRRKLEAVGPRLIHNRPARAISSANHGSAAIIVACWVG